MNLVGNAIKFTEIGGVKIRAAVAAEGPEPRFLCEVEDTGIGIQPENLERIFRPFDQADNSITRKFGGTGLGLTICRNIAHELGGDVSVGSQPGKGSIFRVAVETGPLDAVRFINEPFCEVLRADPRDTRGVVTRQTLPPMRILLVEDGETNRELISLVLTEAGADIVCAENGREGVDAAMRGSFDLVLMDMQMPVMDGYTRSPHVAGQRLPPSHHRADRPCHARRSGKMPCRRVLGLSHQAGPFRRAFGRGPIGDGRPAAKRTAASGQARALAATPNRCRRGSIRPCRPTCPSFSASSLTTSSNWDRN